MHLPLPPSSPQALGLRHVWSGRWLGYLLGTGLPPRGAASSCDPQQCVFLSKAPVGSLGQGPDRELIVGPSVVTLAGGPPHTHPCSIPRLGELWHAALSCMWAPACVRGLPPIFLAFLLASTHCQVPLPEKAARGFLHAHLQMRKLRPRGEGSPSRTPKGVGGARRSGSGLAVTSVTQPSGGPSHQESLRCQFGWSPRGPPSSPHPFPAL